MLRTTDDAYKERPSAREDGGEDARRTRRKGLNGAKRNGKKSLTGTECRDAHRTSARVTTGRGRRTIIRYSGGKKRPRECTVVYLPAARCVWTVKDVSPEGGGGSR